MRKLLLLLLPAIFLTLNVKGQWTPDSTLNTLVADAAFENETTPLMASTPNGYTYISWFKMNVLTNQYDLYMQVLDSVGVERWTPGGKLISSHPQSQTLFRYDLKTDYLGNVVVAFQDQRQGPNYTIAVYKLDINGNHLFGQNGIVLNDSLSNSNLSPVIGFNRRNQTIIAWNASDSLNNKWVDFQKLNAAGGPLFFGPKRIRDANGNKKFSRPNIVPASDTASIIMQYVMETGNFPAVTSTINVQRFDDFGLPVWNPAKTFSTYTIPYFFFPSPVSDKQGGFWMAFNAANTSNPAWTDVFLQHIDSSGNLWNPQGSRVSNIPNEQRFYFDGCLAPTATGLLLAIQITDPSQSSAGVAVQAFSLAGAQQYGPNAITVLPLSSSINQPFGLDNTGISAILCYKIGGSGSDELRATLLNYNGTTTWNRCLSKVSAIKDDMAAGNVVNQQLVVVWKDERINEGIYAQNVSSYGTAGVLTSIETPEQFTSLSVTPNPGKNPEIRLEGNLYGPTDFEITDVQGRRMKSGTFQGNSFYPGIDLPAGLYLVRLTNNGHPALVRWVVE